MEKEIEIIANEHNAYILYAKETKAPIFNEGFIAGVKWLQNRMNTCDFEATQTLKTK